MFNQVVIAMASHGYLGLEGGQLMIEFVVSQCALNVDDKALAKLSSEEVTPISLRDMSCKSLLLITTTIENMDMVNSLLILLCCSYCLWRSVAKVCSCTCTCRFCGRTCWNLLYQLATRGH